MAFISGIVSGIDTESLIKQMLEIERRPAVLLQREQSTIQQKSDAYRDVNTRLNNLAARLGDLVLSTAFSSKRLQVGNTAVATGQAGTSAAVGSYQLDVVQLAKAHMVASDSVADTTSSLGMTGTARINDVDVEITEEMSLADIIKAINDADAGVRAITLNNRLVLESVAPGAANTMDLVDADGSVLAELGVLDESGLIKSELQSAQDAVFSINGIDFTRDSNRVTDALDGVTLNLVGLGSTNITIERNMDQTVTAIRAFVDQYNSTQNFIAEKTAKEALLQGDATITRLAANLQTMATDRVGAPGDLVYDSLSVIGISVDRYGVMSVDESKLRAALEERPGEVEKLFNATTDMDGFDGIAVKLRDHLRSYTTSGNGILSTRQKLFEEQMESIQDSIDRLDARLKIREQSLIRQFTQMEGVLASIQSLGVTLAGQIDQLTGFYNNTK